MATQIGTERNAGTDTAHRQGRKAPKMSTRKKPKECNTEYMAAPRPRLLGLMISHRYTWKYRAHEITQLYLEIYISHDLTRIYKAHDLIKVHKKIWNPRSLT
jgi:hypothetical protein